MIDGSEMISYNYCDVSIAVSGPKGLMVPVIRNAQDLTFKSVELEVKRLAERARDGQITVDEMTGGTLQFPMGVFLVVCYQPQLSILLKVLFWECTTLFKDQQQLTVKLK